MSWFTGFEHIVREAEPLAPYTWFRLGGAAEYFAEPTSRAELAALVQRCTEHDLPIRLLGGGSRVLVPDEGVNGVVIHLAAPAFCQIQVEQQTLIAGGGAKLGHVISTAVREGLGGLESLVGVPGTVAGALRGNADSHGTSIGQWTERVVHMTRQGQVQECNRAQLRFSYRQSNLDHVIVLEAHFQLDRQDSAELTRRMQKLWIMKRASQPSGEHGLGRIFLDPQGMGAAELIEQAGLRGTHVGKAEISERNANFIVAQPGATSRDVAQLIELVKERVASETGIELECELQAW